MVPKIAKPRPLSLFLERWLLPFVPLLVLLSLAGATLLFWKQDVEWRQDVRASEFARHMAITAEQMARQMEEHFEMHLRALEHFRPAWQECYGRDEKSFREEARRVAHAWPGLWAVGWVDPRFILRWVEPVESNRKAEGLDLKTLPGRLTPLHHDATCHDPIVSEPHELVTGGQGFIVDLPLREDGQFHGFIQGVFRLPQFAEDSLLAEAGRHFSVELLDGKNRLFALGEVRGAETAGPLPIIPRRVKIGNRTWLLRLQPRPDYFGQQSLRSATGLLMIGLTLSVILSGVVWLLQARTRLLADQRDLLQVSETRLREMVRNLRLLNRLSAALNQTFDLSRIYEQTLLQLREAFNLDMARIYQLAPTGDHIQLVAQIGIPPEQEAAFQTKPRNSPIVGMAFQTGQRQIVEDWQQDPRPGYERLREMGVRYSVYQPIKHLGQVQSLLVLSYCTDQKLSEAELELLNVIADTVGAATANALQFEEVRLSREYFQSLFNGSSDGILVETLDRQVLLVNPRLCQLLGYTSEDLVGRTSDTLFCDDDRRNVLPGMWERLQKEESVLVEANYLRKDGSELPVEISSRVVRLVDQRLVLTFARDRTLRKQLEQELFQAQKMESIGTLAGGVAHDFNNLLSGILGFGSLALSNMKPTDPHYREVLQMVSAAERGALVVQQLLTLSRKQPPKPRPVQINEVVDQVVHLLRHSLTENIEIRVEKQRALPAVNADPVQWEQVLMNLCLNGRDAIMAAGRPGVLAIRTSSEDVAETAASANIPAGRYVLLEVSDNGSGMDEATRARIFEPFFTTKRVGRGTGLGLTMVFAIVKGHKGFIEVDSAPGRGTTFRIRIPATDAPAEPLTSTPADAPRGHETVLLVDDDLGVLDLTRVMLERSGYNVITARDAIEGFEIYNSRRDQIDLVVTDLIMPKVSGAEFVAQLRHVDPRLKIIIATGYAADAEALTKPGNRPNATIQKPFRMAELAQIVRQVLDGSPDARPPGSNN
ncbi:MAG: PAS domain S-box protein [Verrucomicrobiae bacterium]|nr:PAS domain S-box protein [Verrucomicrobiae bacterium]